MWEWKIRKTNTRSEESIWERLSFLFFETTHGFLTFWKIRKTNTRSEESIWERLSFLFFETTHGFLTFLLLSSLAAIFIVHSIVGTFEISFYKKIELHKSILSNRNDSDLRKCEGVFDVNSNGHITRSELWEYDNCISRINERRKEDEAQRKLDSLGIWEQGDE